MKTTIFVRGQTHDQINTDVENHARRMLGRLRRHITAAEFLLTELAMDTGPDQYRCTLRLRLDEGGDIHVQARGVGHDAALTDAFSQARRALLRRRRTSMQLPAWSRQLQAALT